MSTYRFTSLHFMVRESATVELEALAAVARGEVPEPRVMGQLHPGVQRYLADHSRFLDDEAEPRVGSPVRLAQSSDMSRTRLSIEMCFHDDAFANGGYVFWLWVLSLVELPLGIAREVIGLEGIYRNDPETSLLLASSAGIHDGSTLISREAIDGELKDWATWTDWSG